MERNLWNCSHQVCRVKRFLLLDSSWIRTVHSHGGPRDTSTSQVSVPAEPGFNMCPDSGRRQKKKKGSRLSELHHDPGGRIPRSEDPS